MAQPTPSPVRPVDDEARRLLADVLNGATFAALGTTHPDIEGPYVSHIAFALGPAHQPVTLISDLSLHARALQADARCGLLVGEPGDKGDPLTHPRASLSCEARFVTRRDERFAALQTHYLQQRPKAKLYADFGDFNFVVFDVRRVDLNGGFGKAFRFDEKDFAELDL